MDMDYFRSTFRLLPGSDKPLYQQLYVYFKRLIKAGILKEGDLMIPEIAICEELNVSRSTVRKAMDLLIEEGLIARHRGKGTHVRNPKMKRAGNDLYNFTENVRNIGAIPSSIVLEAIVLEGDEVPQNVSKLLELSKNNEKVYKLHRIRCANGEPVLNEMTYISYMFCPGIEMNDFSSESLYKILEDRYYLNIHHATETIEAVIISKEDKKLLHCTKDMAGFQISRISYLDSGVPYEYTTSVTRSDKCSFQMELYKKPATGGTEVEVSRSALNI